MKIILPVNEVFYGDVDQDEVDEMLVDVRAHLRKAGFWLYREICPNSDSHKEIWIDREDSIDEEETDFEWGELLDLDLSEREQRLEQWITTEWLTYRLEGAWAVSNFIASVWDEESFKTEDSEELWSKIALHEARRTFRVGYNYCRSKLTISPLRGRRWVYETTRCTQWKVWQKTWIRLGEDAPLPVRMILRIPRWRQGGMHHGLAERFSQPDFVPYYSWGTLYYSQPGTPEYEAAKRLGMEVKADKPEPPSTPDPDLALESGPDDSDDIAIPDDFEISIDE